MAHGKDSSAGTLSAREKKWYDAALALPDVSEGVSCAGTSLERRTAVVKKKAFLFIGKGDARLKLQTSLPEAQAISKQYPAEVTVGKGGWVALKCAPKTPLTDKVVLSWIAESYSLMAGPPEKR